MLRHWVILITLIFLTCGSVAAQEWSTESKEDVFTGQRTAVMMGGAFQTMLVYINCWSGEVSPEYKHVDLSLLFPAKAPHNGDEIKGKALLKIDGYKPVEVNVVRYSHNENYVGFHTQVDSEKVKTIVREIAVAKGKILAGIEATDIDLKYSEQYGVSGSTLAAETFMKACGIDPAGIE